MKQNGKGIKFERIRRICGYLVGTLDRWNNAKRAEERDRVKHSLKQMDNERVIPASMKAPNSQNSQNKDGNTHVH